MGHNVVGMNGGDNESIQVVFSAQSRDAIIYVTVIFLYFFILKIFVFVIYKQ